MIPLSPVFLSIAYFLIALMCVAYRNVSFTCALLIHLYCLVVAICFMLCNELYIVYYFLYSSCLSYRMIEQIVLFSCIDNFILYYNLYHIHFQCFLDIQLLMLAYSNHYCPRHLSHLQDSNTTRTLICVYCIMLLFLYFALSFI